MYISRCHRLGVDTCILDHVGHDGHICLGPCQFLLQAPNLGSLLLQFFGFCMQLLLLIPPASVPHPSGPPHRRPTPRGTVTIFDMFHVVLVRQTAASTLVSAVAPFSPLGLVVHLHLVSAPIEFLVVAAFEDPGSCCLFDDFFSVVSGRPCFFGVMASTGGTNNVSHCANPLHAFIPSTRDAMADHK